MNNKYDVSNGTVVFLQGASIKEVIDWVNQYHYTKAKGTKFTDRDLDGVDELVTSGLHGDLSIKLIN